MLKFHYCKTILALILFLLLGCQKSIPVPNHVEGQYVKLIENGSVMIILQWNGNDEWQGAVKGHSYKVRDIKSGHIGNVFEYRLAAYLHES